ncbi:hypothetical protein M1M86_01750 [Dehalococcoidales bacterium]|nr:hypothetical protein [Dehalococcoidales bacterium]
MIKLIAYELVRHIPFTALGATTGIVIMVIMVLANVPAQISYTAYYILHPLHVLLSAVVTTAMFVRYSKGKVWAAILIGYVGSIGIATLSDALIPYLGGALVGIKIEFHIPFIEEWWLINPLALIGIAIGYWKNITKFPHYGHVLLSTWASLFYFAAFGIAHWIPLLHFVFLFLFLAVWLPCCLSDIVFPLLFVNKRLPLQKM